MRYLVKSRELKWAGKPLKTGDEVVPKSDRDLKHIALLKTIGKVEEADDKPVRKVASVKPRQADPEPEAPVEAPAEAPAEEPKSASVEALSTEDLPTTGRYQTRRLKAED